MVFLIVVFFGFVVVWVKVLGNYCGLVLFFIFVGIVIIFVMMVVIGGVDSYGVMFLVFFLIIVVYFLGFKLVGIFSVLCGVWVLIFGCFDYVGWIFDSLLGLMGIEIFF